MIGGIDGCSATVLGVTTWDELRPVLQRLAAEQPDALESLPDPSSAYQSGPPFEIHLQAFAVDLAGELYERFGADVRLRVGVMSFPDKQLEDPRLADPLPDLPLAEQAGLDVHLAEPLTVRSGRSIEHAVLIFNQSDVDVEVTTGGGNLLSAVLDPRTGRYVGRYFGPVLASLGGFQVAPGTQTRISVWVGTTSVVPELGYAVPPGDWHLQVIVGLADGRGLRSAPLPMTITA